MHARHPWMFYSYGWSRCAYSNLHTTMHTSPVGPIKTCMFYTHTHGCSWWVNYHLNTSTNWSNSPSSHALHKWICLVCLQLLERNIFNVFIRNVFIYVSLGPIKKLHVRHKRLFISLCSQSPEHNDAYVLLSLVWLKLHPPPSPFTPFHPYPLTSSSTSLGFVRNTMKWKESRRRRVLCEARLSLGAAVLRRDEQLLKSRLVSGVRKCWHWSNRTASSGTERWGGTFKFSLALSCPLGQRCVLRPLQEILPFLFLPFRLIQLHSFNSSSNIRGVYRNSERNFYLWCDKLCFAPTFACDVLTCVLLWRDLRGWLGIKI